MADFNHKLRSDSIIVSLIKLILELSAEQRVSLLKQVEKMVHHSFDEDIRESLRKPYSGALTFILDNLPRKGNSKDLSSGGMFIETEEIFSVGDVITILFPNPQKKNDVKIPAKIVRTLPNGIGVEFIKKV